MDNPETLTTYEEK